MDINYYKSLEPLFGSWHITKLIGEGSFGKVFEIERKDETLGRSYKAALKVISIPYTDGEVESLISEGMTEDSATDYFKEILNDVVDEYDLMAKLKGNSYIVSCEDYVVIPKKTGIGWDILIRMELLNPLVRKLNEGELSEAETIKLGIDLCRALESCQKYNIIHRDIKPENIFISELGEYKLGDFGIARTAEKTTSGMSKKGTFTYMAPEVYLGASYGKSVDIYSVGLVMYRLLNKNRAPFFPPYPEVITYAKKENALRRRMSGETIPLPINGSDELKKIVMKASAFASKDRYANPEDMRRDLEALEGKAYELFANEKAEAIEDEKTETLLKNRDEEEKTETLLKNRVDEEKKTESEKVTFEKEDSDKTLSVYSEGIISDKAVINKPKENVNPKEIVKSNKKSSKAWIFVLVAILAIAGVVAVVAINKSKSLKKMTTDDKIMEFVECSTINGKSIMKTDNIVDYVGGLMKNTSFKEEDGAIWEKTNIKNGILCRDVTKKHSIERFYIADAEDATKWINYEYEPGMKREENAYIPFENDNNKNLFGLDQYLLDKGYKGADDIVKGFGVDIDTLKKDSYGELMLDTEKGQLTVVYFESNNNLPCYQIKYYNEKEAYEIGIMEWIFGEEDPGIVRGKYLIIKIKELMEDKKPISLQSQVDIYSDYIVVDGETCESIDKMKEVLEKRGCTEVTYIAHTHNDDWIENIANAINEIKTVKTVIYGESNNSGNVSLEDTEVYETEQLTMALKPDESGLQKYCIAKVVIMVDSKNPDYEKRGDLSKYMSVMQNEIVDVIDSKTYEEAINNQEQMKQEILIRLQELFDSDFIYKVNFSEILFG